MDFLRRAIFLCLISETLTWSKPYDPCKNTPVCDFDCCYDYLICREKDEEAIYLGADSILRIKNADKGFDINFAYRYYNLYFKSINKYWKPRKYEYLRWHKHGGTVLQLDGAVDDTDCLVESPIYQPLNQRKSYLVASLFYNNAYIVVCRNKINIFRSVGASGQFMLKKETIPRDGYDCHLRYPLLCTDQDGKPELIDAFTLDDAWANEFMVVYYGAAQVNDPKLYDREYTIVAYHPRTYNTSQVKVYGQLSAIDIYEIDEKVAKGLIALNDGRVCPFVHKIGDTNFDFEHHGSIMDGCRALQTYLACPQAWCVDTLIDSSFTVNQMQNKEEVYFVLYNNMWVVNAKPLPMDVPMHGQHRVWLQDYSTVLSKVVKKVRRETSAAFTYDDGDGDEVVISSLPYSENANWEAVVVKDHPNEIAHRISGSIGDIKNPDAAWFDKAMRTLYLFEGDKYYTFENKANIYSGSAWRMTGGGSTGDLGLKDFDGNADDGIDAVVSMGGRNYFFNQQFRFYQIDDGQTQATGQSKLAQKDFFRLLSQCYYNDYDSYQDILYRNKEAEPLHQFVVNKTGEYPTESLEASEVSLAPFIIAIIIFGALVAIIGLVVLYVLIRRQDHFRTILVKRQPKQKGVFLTTVFKNYKGKQSKQKYTSKQLKQKSTVNSLMSKSAANSLKQKSTANSLTSKSVVKSVSSKSTK